MQFLSIGINKSSADVVNNIADELKRIKKVNYSIDKHNANGPTSIVCSMDEGHLQKEKPAYSTLALHVSNALANYIIRQYEEKLIERIIKNNYCYFNALEKKEILKNALKIIRNDENNFLNSLFQIRRKNIIIRKLLDYFEGSNSLMLDGFINFRLKDYIKDLEDIVDKAVDEFLVEREYREFIRLLKYFVETQKSKCKTIHVVIPCDGKYVLLDENRNEVTHKYVQEFINEISEGVINHDDLLVSSLIMLAPRRVVLHNIERFKNKELLGTIRSVFVERLVTCNKCEICHKTKEDRCLPLNPSGQRTPGRKGLSLPPHRS